MLHDAVMSIHHKTYRERKNCTLNYVVCSRTLYVTCKPRLKLFTRANASHSPTIYRTRPCYNFGEDAGVGVIFSHSHSTCVSIASKEHRVAFVEKCKMSNTSLQSVDIVHFPCNENAVSSLNLLRNYSINTKICILFAICKGVRLKYKYVMAQII